MGGEHALCRRQKDVKNLRFAFCSFILNDSRAKYSIEDDFSESCRHRYRKIRCQLSHSCVEGLASGHCRTGKLCKLQLMNGGGRTNALVVASLGRSG